MTRKLVVLLAFGLLLAPAASAKGPHAVLSSGPESVEAGRPWVATVELNEFSRTPHPRFIASRGDRRVTAKLRPVPASVPGAAGFRLRVVFPTDGRWRLALVAAERRFSFPLLAVGSGDVPQDYVAFPKGSNAERQGAGGVWTEGPAVDAIGGGTPLPPEVVSVAEPSREGGMSLWIPALGLALAGAGVFTLRFGIGRRR
jgi:hypothetical protein